MLIQITDANNVTQTAVINTQEAVYDRSGTLASTNVSQQAVAANSNRSGFFIQNLGSHNLWFNELGLATETAGSVLLPPNASISTTSGYPLSTGAINVIGTVGDSFTIREW